MIKSSSHLPSTITILGPTASGKTRRAVQLAHAFGGEIVSCDSRQVYKGMDIGTGKDIEEYAEIPVHMIDVCPAGERYNLHRFLTDARCALEDIRKRGQRIILCGGSGMYLENLIAGISLPEVPVDDELRKTLANKTLEELTDILKTYKRLHNTTDVDTLQRAVRAIEIAKWYESHPEEAELADRRKVSPIDTILIGIDIPREKRREKIDTRLKQRLEEGMIDEVKCLLADGVTHETLVYYGLEYKFLSFYLQGQLSYDEMVDGLLIAIHQFAKRQMTWFRGMERRGTSIKWVHYLIDTEELIDKTRQWLAG